MLSRAPARPGIPTGEQRTAAAGGGAYAGAGEKDGRGRAQGGEARDGSCGGRQRFHRARKTILRALTAGLIACAAASPAVAQIAPYDDFKHTPRHYAAKARAGDAYAQLYLGLALEALGPEAEKRWGKARDWIERAAAQDLPEAQLRLAQIMLAEGDGASALPLLDAAAESGSTAAQFNRASLAQEAGDAALAGRWYEAAARQGHGPAQFNLALLLFANAPAEALAWLTLAAETDTPNAAAARNQVMDAVDPATRAKAAELVDAFRP